MLIPGQLVPLVRPFPRRCHLIRLINWQPQAPEGRGLRCQAAPCLSAAGGTAPGARCSVPALLAVFVPGSGGETNVEFHSSTDCSARSARAVGLCPPCPPQGQGGARGTYGQGLRVWWGCGCLGGPGASRTGSLRLSVPQCTGLGLPCWGAVQELGGSRRVEEGAGARWWCLALP